MARPGQALPRGQHGHEVLRPGSAGRPERDGPGLLVQHVHGPDLSLGVVGDLPQGDPGDLLDLGLRGQLPGEPVQRLGLLLALFHGGEHALQLGLLPLEFRVLLLHFVPGRLKFLRPWR